jgi:N utilization substance protein A
VKVPEDQLSLAIGKQGQNVRLAAKLTGWNIDIISADESRVEAAAEAAMSTATPDEGAVAPAEKPKRRKNDLEASLIDLVNQGSGDEAEPSEEPGPDSAAS